jgi:signal peptidase I
MNAPNENQSLPGTRKHRAAREVAFFGALLTVLVTTRASFADQYTVPSESMMPTVHIGDRIFVSKISYGLRIPLTNVYLSHFQPPERGDVVVLDSPDQPMVLLKRVVAVPGDRVRVSDGCLVINGREVPVTDSSDGPVERFEGHGHRLSFESGGGPDFEATVPDGQYFVLGDNRGNSRDGRYFGFVSSNRILGHARGVFLRDGGITWLPL